MKRFLKLMAFLMAAVITGTVASYITVEYKLEHINFKLGDENQKVVSTSSKTRGNIISNVAEKVSPSVVGISNEGDGFFGPQIKGSGSGIIFNEKGYIVTNNHVIQNAAKITVKLSNGKVYNSKLVGSDPRTDLAVIKIEGNDFQAAKFGDSSKVRVGDVAIAIGNPLGEEFSGSVTSGIISAVNRKIYVGESEYKLIQTDAAINPGNSGGALCNEYGEVIGINSLKIGSEKNAEGMGFAITINSVKHIIESLMKYGQVSRPELGIYGKVVESTDGKLKGIGIEKVIQGSGAEKAGLVIGDVILEFDGSKVSSLEELRSVIEIHKIGDNINCKVWRREGIKNVKIQLLDLSKITEESKKQG